MMLLAVQDVAREHAIPMAVFWIQPATVLAAYYHYFHGSARSSPPTPPTPRTR
jgi:hypothetical protein